MLSTSISLGLSGIQAHLVEIEVDIIKGLPGFTIVGLPDSTIRESKDRIRSAIENSGFEFPPQNFIVNLAPAGFKKQGANFDLPISVSILRSTFQLEGSSASIPMVGELSLNGNVKPVKGVISMVIALYQKGYRSVIVPYDNRLEAAAIPDVAIYPVKSIKDTISVLNNEQTPFCPPETEGNIHPPSIDYSDIRGQESAKRAIEIAAAGHHNILLYGAPGSGKTMIARRIPTILPPLTRDEAIETTMIHSSSSQLKHGQGLLTIPPFRSPHHTSSDVALIGGGSNPTAGEVSLAHNGVLFLDEFVEFKSNVIQALRQPLEDQEVTISRAASTQVFPADFMLVAASNPCQCGFLFDRETRCTCQPFRVRNYFQKISGPIIDRIDLEVLVNKVPYKNLMTENKSNQSLEMRQRVMTARAIQAERYADSTTCYNARMTPGEIKKYCILSADTQRTLENSIKKMSLTARSFFKTLKLSRTIADIEGSGQIQKHHILEALSYKNLQRNYAL